MKSDGYASDRTHWPPQPFPRSSSPDSREDAMSTGIIGPDAVALAVPQSRPPRTYSPGSGSCGRIIMTLCMPSLAVWWAAAFFIAWLVTFMVLPSWLLARRLYWACPFVPFIFSAITPAWKGWALRIGFEASYCINVVTRFLTLPMRRALPSFYIVGFPKCGTTSLSEHLKLHPGISSPAGLPYHDALCKETHYFEGVLGRTHASSALLYRSFFPTVMTKWWAEVVKGVPKWMCFDACPVHACLPYVARRIAHVTPDAKIIIMLRDPVPGVFSAEVMLSDLGMPLPWGSLSTAVTPNDPRFKAPDKSEVAFWEGVAQLDVQEPLPVELPHELYFKLNGILRCGRYYDLIQPYLECFPPDNIMIINFDDFRSHTDEVVRDVLQFVGADPDMQPKHAELAPAMQNTYKGRAMHPTVHALLREFYRPSIEQLQALLKRQLGWGADVEVPADMKKT